MDELKTDLWEKNVAVVILNYNCSQLTITNVDQILNISSDIHIVVVDNCSTDDSVKCLRERYSDTKNVDIVENMENRGYASGNNYGIHFVKKNYSDVKVVLISNPDIFIPNIEIIKKMYNALMKDENLGAVTVKTILNGTINEPNESCWYFFSIARLILIGNIFAGRFVHPKRYKKYTMDGNGVSYVDVVQGCFFMCRLDVLTEINYLDEGTFLYSEEQILARRLNQAGYRNGILPDCYIYHNHQVKDKALIKLSNKLFDIQCYYDSRIYYIRKYLKLPAIVKFVMISMLKFDLFVKKVYFKLTLK